MNRFSIATVATAAFMVLLAQEVVCGQEVEEQRIVPLQLANVGAAKAAKKLAAILGTEAEVFADEATNSVWFRGRPDWLERAKEILKRLDVPSYWFLVPVKNTDAARTAKTLRMVLRLLRLLGDDRDVHVAADGKGESIFIHASKEKAKEVTKMIRWLDERPK